MIRLRDDDIEIVSYDDKVNPEDIVRLANNRKVSINFKRCVSVSLHRRGREEMDRVREFEYENDVSNSCKQ